MDDLERVIDRFLARVEASSWSACWIWTGFVKESGYGLSPAQQPYSRLAHRRAYELAIGPIPDGLTLDHLCQRRFCVNPLHLEPVTLEENLRRIDRTLCRKKLHEMTGRNVRVSVSTSGKEIRGCRACDIAYKEAKRRQRGAAERTFYVNRD